MSLVKPSYIGTRRTNVDVLFLGESPGEEEAEKGEAFVGRSGKLLRDIISSELRGRCVVLDNAVPEYLGRDSSMGSYCHPGIKTIRSYDQYVHDTIRRHRPRAVVALGKVALQALGQPGTRILSRAGDIFKFNGTACVSGVHPAYVLRNLTEMHLLETTFNSLRAVLGRSRRETIGVHRNLGDLSLWLRKVSHLPCGFDIETSTFDPHSGSILTVAISTGRETYWIPIHHAEGRDRYSERRLQYIAEWWPRGPRVVQNLKFELAWMRSSQAAVASRSGDTRGACAALRGAGDPPRCYDTMLQAWLINENLPKSLNWLVINRLKKKPYWSDIDYDKMDELPLDTVGEYNALDALYCMKLHDLQWEMLTPKQRDLHDRVLIPMAKLLCSMEHRGLRVDLKSLDGFIKRTERELANGLDDIEATFPGLNINSPAQMQRLLFGKLQLEPLRRTSTDRPSSDAKTVEHLSKQEPRLAGIVAVRQIKRQLSTGLLPIRKLQRKGYIHTSFNFGDVVTGRLGSRNPNLQNIKRDAPYKKAFISRFKSGKIVQVDYKQHELRVMAAVAGEESLLRAFRADRDVHQVTADELRISRHEGKTLNLALIYGMGVGRLVDETGWEWSKAASFRKRWLCKYATIPELWEKIRQAVQRDGYIENMFGRRRHFDDTEVEDIHAIKQSYNFPIQSAAVEIVYHAMIDMEDHITSAGWRSVLVHQEHDKVIFDCPSREVNKVIRMARQIMCAVKTPIPIPLGVDVKVKEHL